MSKFEKAGKMKVIVDFCVIPIGVGCSLSSYIAECQRILKQAGLTFELHAGGTNIEGEWDDVMAAVKNCHEKLHEIGAPRVHTSIHLSTRHDKDQSMEDRVNSVKAKI